jgi:adenylate kinase
VGDANGNPTTVRVIFFGYPGAGKGTQAARLCAHLHLPKISTGDMLRNAISAGTPLGQKAGPLMERGELVPDDLLVELIASRIDDDDCAEGYILDGFPRTLPQAESFELMVGGARSLVFKIDIAREKLLARLSGRRWCPDCQGTFHLENERPRIEGICDRCGSQLIQREDDKAAVVQRRLNDYEAQTRPVVRFYESLGEVYGIDGDRPVDTVSAEIRGLVEAARTASHA